MQYFDTTLSSKINNSFFLFYGEHNVLIYKSFQIIFFILFWGQDSREGLRDIMSSEQTHFQFNKKLQHI